MKTNTYPTLVALILPACASSKTVQYGTVLEDSGYNQHDTGEPLLVDDTGFSDTGLYDPGQDTGFLDTCVLDTGAYDTWLSDTGMHDTSLRDSGSFDTGLYDTALVDTGVSDSGVLDTGRYDTALVDSGSFDTGYSPEQWCATSTVPESVPFVTLLPQHYALVDDDKFFETNTGSRSKPVIEDSVYTLNDTYGCSCERILDCKPSTALTGEDLYGCTEGTMKDWVAQRGWAAYCE